VESKLRPHYATNHRPPLRVAIGGLGAIGRQITLSLDAGIPGLELCAVSARDFDKAADFLAQLQSTPRLVTLPELAALADVVVECAPAAVFDEVSVPAIEAGRILVTMSSAALLFRKNLINRAAETGARIIVPSGGIIGLDGLRAAAESDVQSVVLITRKSPRSLAGAPYLAKNYINVEQLAQATMVFEGNTLDAARAFPANINVAATLSLAGIEPERMRVEIWADPAIEHNLQEVRVEAAAACFQLRMQSAPLPSNPRTGSLTPLSAIAALRALTAHLTIGG